MSKITDWLEQEGERLEKQDATTDEPFKTVNHSFIQGFYYAQAHIEILEEENKNKATQYRKAIQNRIVNFNMKIAWCNERRNDPYIEAHLQGLLISRAEALAILDELKKIDKSVDNLK